MKKLLVLSFLWCACALAEAPSTVAIRNAKIVTVSGPVIAKGTVILKDGLIEAVGENVTVPADAWVVDGEGMTVYPGLIDALAPWECRARRRRRAAADVGDADATAPAQAAARPHPWSARWGPEDRPQTTSWLLAADELYPGDQRIETVRGGGITTAVTFPTRGIFAGQGSLIDLVIAARRPAKWCWFPRLGSISRWPRGRGFGGGGGFPGSLMGVIAYIRQIYLDADHYKLVKDAYAKDPRGMQRPRIRPRAGRRDGLQALSSARQPLVEIDRMLRFGGRVETCRHRFFTAPAKLIAPKRPIC